MSLIHGLHKDTLLEINGKLTSIGNISVGDKVQGYDTQNGVYRDNRVVRVETKSIDSYLKLKLSDGTELKTSVDIKIYKDGEWISPIGNTSCASDDCKCSHKSFFNDIKVISVQLVEESIDVVSIEVEPDHNYFIGNLLVHNTGPQGPKGQKGQKGATGHRSSGSTGAQVLKYLGPAVDKVVRFSRLTGGTTTGVKGQGGKKNRWNYTK